jgi:ribosomal protein S18 acetylase RimI-like enzyme
VVVELVAGTQEHVGTLAAALAGAFATDPVFEWLLPDESGREGRLRKFFSLELSKVVLVDGWASTSDSLEGAALCLPPGKWRLPMRRSLANGRGFLGVFGTRLPWAMGLLWRMEAVHPRDQHYYMPYIGVAPEAQGRGLGTALMQPLLERCDREGLPAYLEATCERNALLYERLGFRHLRELRFAGSPPLLLMQRSAQTSR